MLTDVTKILHAAVTVGAPDYIYDRATLVKLELEGHVYVAGQFHDFNVYKATAQGVQYFSRGYNAR